mmetsp:Transcript_150959/g.263802  ORF Transcript_150959/g.263802 Transcript_150959/m.263802 type:complete len:249 (-) Transcript_150959:318-1064(-)
MLVGLRLRSCLQLQGLQALVPLRSFVLLERLLELQGCSGPACCNWRGRPLDICTKHLWPPLHLCPVFWGQNAIKPRVKDGRNSRTLSLRQPLRVLYSLVHLKLRPPFRCWLLGSGLPLLLLFCMLQGSCCGLSVKTLLPLHEVRNICYWDPMGFFQADTVLQLRVHLLQPLWHWVGCPICSQRHLIGWKRCVTFPLNGEALAINILFHFSPFPWLWYKFVIRDTYIEIVVKMEMLLPKFVDVLDLGLV